MASRPTSAGRNQSPPALRIGVPTSPLTNSAGANVARILDLRMTSSVSASPPHPSASAGSSPHDVFRSPPPLTTTHHHGAATHLSYSPPHFPSAGGASYASLEADRRRGMTANSLSSADAARASRRARHGSVATAASGVAFSPTGGGGFGNHFGNIADSSFDGAAEGNTADGADEWGDEGYAYEPPTMAAASNSGNDAGAVGFGADTMGNTAAAAEEEEEEVMLQSSPTVAPRTHGGAAAHIGDPREKGHPVDVGSSTPIMTGREPTKTPVRAGRSPRPLSASSHRSTASNSRPGSAQSRRGGGGASPAVSGGGGRAQQQHQQRLTPQRRGSALISSSTPRGTASSRIGNGRSASTPTGATNRGGALTPQHNSHHQSPHQRASFSHHQESADAAAAARETRRIKSYVRIRPLVPAEVAQHEAATREYQNQISSLHHHQSNAGNGRTPRSGSPLSHGSDGLLNGHGHGHHHNGLATSGPQPPAPLSCVAVGDDGRSIRLADDAPCTLDGVFAPDAAVSDLIDAIVGPNIRDALGGHHTSILLYGQTGSGKSYTLQELLPAFVEGLFRLAEDGAPHYETTVSVEAQQIYLESISDLLAPDRTDLQIREFPDTGIYVRGALEVPVASPAEFHTLWAEAVAHRAVASTRMNHYSSRSHCVVTFSVKRRRRVTREQFSTLSSNNTSASPQDLSSLTSGGGGVAMATCGKVSFADLAGSERLKKSGSEGTRKHEAIAINQSLSTLGNVMQALADTRASHVPFRESKLTRLLQESLAGGGSSCLLTTLSPFSGNYHESKSSLAFAMRAMRVVQAVTTWREVDGKTRMMETQDWLENRVHILEERLRAVEAARLQAEAEAAAAANANANENDADGVASADGEDDGLYRHLSASPSPSSPHRVECTNCLLAASRIMELEGDLALLRREHSALAAKCDIKVDNLQQSLEFAMGEASGLRQRLAEAEAATEDAKAEAAAAVAKLRAMVASGQKGAGGEEETDASYAQYGGESSAAEGHNDYSDDTDGEGEAARLFGAAAAALSKSGANPLHQRRLADLKAYYDGYVESANAHLAEVTAERDAASQEVMTLAKELTEARADIMELLKAKEEEDAETEAEREENRRRREEEEAQRKAKEEASSLNENKAASLAASEEAALKLEQLLAEKIDEADGLTALLREAEAALEATKGQHRDAVAVLEADVAYGQAQTERLRAELEAVKAAAAESAAANAEQQSDVANAAEAAIGELTAALSKSEAERQRLETVAAEASQSLEAAHEAYQSELRAVASERSAHAAEGQKARVTIASLEAQLEAFRSAHRTDTDAAVSGLQQLADAHAAEAAAAEERHQSHMAEARRVSEALLEQLKEARDEEELARAEAAEKLSAAASEASRLQAALRSAVREKADTEQLMREHMALADEAVAEAGRLRDGHSGAHERLAAEAEALRAAAETTAEAHAEQLARLREQHAAAIAALRERQQAESDDHEATVLQLEEKLSNTLAVLQTRTSEVERLKLAAAGDSSRLEAEVVRLSSALAEAEEAGVAQRLASAEALRALSLQKTEAEAAGAAAVEAVEARLAAALRSSTEEAKAQSGRLRALQQQHEEELATLEADAQRRIEAASEELSALRAVMRQAKAETAAEGRSAAEAHAAEVARLEALLADAQQQTVAAEQSAQKAEAQSAAAFTKRINALEAALAEAKEAHGAALANAKASHDLATKAAAKRAAEALSDAEARHSAALSAVKVENEEAVAQLRRQLQSAKSERVATEARLTRERDAAADALEQLRGEMAAAAAAHSSANKETTELRALLAQKKATVGELQRDLFEARLAAEGSAEETAQLRAKLVELQQRSEAMTARVAEELSALQQEAEASEEARTALKERASKAEAAASDARKEASALSSKLSAANAALESGRADESSRTNEALAEVANLRQTLAASAATAAKKADAIKTLQGDLEAARAATEAAEERCADVEAEAARALASAERQHQQRVTQLSRDHSAAVSLAADEAAAAQLDLSNALNAARGELRRREVEVADLEARLASAEVLHAEAMALVKARSSAPPSRSASVRPLIPNISGGGGGLLSGSTIHPTAATTSSNAPLLRDQIARLESEAAAAETAFAEQIATVRTNADATLKATVAALRQQHTEAEAELRDEMRQREAEAAATLAAAVESATSVARLEADELRKDAKHWRAEAALFERRAAEAAAEKAQSDRSHRAELRLLGDKLTAVSREKVVLEAWKAAHAVAASNGKAADNQSASGTTSVGAIAASGSTAGDRNFAAPTPLDGTTDGNLTAEGIAAAASVAAGAFRQRLEAAVAERVAAASLRWHAEHAAQIAALEARLAADAKKAVEAALTEQRRSAEESIGANEEKARADRRSAAAERAAAEKRLRQEAAEETARLRAALSFAEQKHMETLQKLSAEHSAALSAATEAARIGAEAQSGPIVAALTTQLDASQRRVVSLTSAVAAARQEARTAGFKYDALEAVMAAAASSPDRVEGWGDGRHRIFMENEDGLVGERTVESTSSPMTTPEMGSAADTERQLMVLLATKTPSPAPSSSSVGIPTAAIAAANAAFSAPSLAAIDAVRKGYEHRLAALAADHATALKAAQIAAEASEKALEGRIAALRAQLDATAGTVSQSESTAATAQADLEAKVRSLSAALEATESESRRLQRQLRAAEERNTSIEKLRQAGLEESAARRAAAEETHRAALLRSERLSEERMAALDEQHNAALEAAKALADDASLRSATEIKRLQRQITSLSDHLARRGEELSAAAAEAEGLQRRIGQAEEKSLRDSSASKAAVQCRDQQIALLRAQLIVFEETTARLTLGGAAATTASAAIGVVPYVVGSASIDSNNTAAAAAAGNGNTSSNSTTATATTNVGVNSSGNGSALVVSEPDGFGNGSTVGLYDAATTAIRRYADEARAGGQRLQSLRDAHDAQLADLHSAHSERSDALHAEVDRHRRAATAAAAEAAQLREDVAAARGAAEEAAEASKTQIAAVERRLETANAQIASLRASVAAAEADANAKAVAAAAAAELKASVSTLTERATYLEGKLASQEEGSAALLDSLTAQHSEALKSLRTENAVLRREALESRAAIASGASAAESEADRNAARLHSHGIQLAAAKALVADAKRQLAALRGELATERRRRAELAAMLEALANRPDVGKSFLAGHPRVDGGRVDEAEVPRTTSSSSTEAAAAAVYDGIVQTPPAAEAPNKYSRREDAQKPDAKGDVLTAGERESLFAMLEALRTAPTEGAPKAKKSSKKESRKMMESASELGSESTASPRNHGARRMATPPPLSDADAAGKVNKRRRLQLSPVADFGASSLSGASSSIVAAPMRPSSAATSTKKKMRNRSATAAAEEVTSATRTASDLIAHPFLHIDSLHPYAPYAAAGGFRRRSASTPAVLPAVSRTRVSKTETAMVSAQPISAASKNVRRSSSAGAAFAAPLQRTAVFVNRSPLRSAASNSAAMGPIMASPMMQMHPMPTVGCPYCPVHSGASMGVVAPSPPYTTSHHCPLHARTCPAARRSPSLHSLGFGTSPVGPLAHPEALF